MDEGKISVIVPCYNIEGFVEKTVQSILAQTYQNTEIILVDDGSTDDTVNIIERLAREHTRVHAFHKKNGGVSSARLYGIEKATGDWITFVDGDDLLKPEMYSVLINNAIEYDADISHCGYEMVFPNHIDKYYGTGRKVIQTQTDGLRELLSGQFIEPALWNKIYKRELIIDSLEDCAKHLEIRYLEDLLWNYYFFKRALSSVYVDECYYQYVLRKNSAAKAKPNKYKIQDPWRVLRIIHKDIGGSEELTRIIKTREILKLVSLSVIETSDMPSWAEVCRERALFLLRRNRRHVLNGNYSLRLKMMVLLASISPQLYLMVYKIYSRLKGTANKYDL